MQHPAPPRCWFSTCSYNTSAQEVVQPRNLTPFNSFLWLVPLKTDHSASALKAALAVGRKCHLKGFQFIFRPATSLACTANDSINHCHWKHYFFSFLLKQATNNLFSQWNRVTQMALYQIWKHLKVDESQILEGDNRGKKNIKYTWYFNTKY